VGGGGSGGRGERMTDNIAGPECHQLITLLTIRRIVMSTSHISRQNGGGNRLHF
jgi:hypothetical protein